MPKFLFNKLIRDKLPEEYIRLNQIAEYKPLSHSELSHELVNKIIEEVKEIPADGPKSDIVAELADAKQAMDDLMKLHGISIDDIAKVQRKKFNKKGGFSKGNFVVSLDLKDDDEWITYYRAEPGIFIEFSEQEVGKDVPFIKPGIYKHYKGKKYEVIGVGLDSETTKPVVVYMPLDETGVPFWVRPYEMFLEFVDYNGKKVKRFEKIDA